ncbi:thioesterase family protein [Phenylobacterium sp.]|uniref:thioesterase family protein n=1 Tax=Phenylobacterium sp. TaxID=1871053 RepID=UPI0035630766
MGEAVEVWRGSVAMWECDAMGHLNVGFYVAKAMEGLAGLAAELGMAHAFAPDARATLMVREQHIRFLREARPNAPLVMTGGVVEIGETDARLLLLLRHGSGELAASFQSVVAHATAREGRPFPWPGRVLERAEALRIAVPPEAAARSLGLDPVQSQASLARADALGVRRTALGAVGAEHCDAFGRMRAEQMMARISAAIPHILEGRRSGAEGEGARLGGAALEYRLIHLDWPRAGDRVELRSGASGGDARFRRLTHWLLDPDSGKAWGVAEAIAVSFDLETRKIVTLSDEALAAANAQVIAGLTL